MEKIKGLTKEDLKEGHWRLKPPASKEEVRLAAKDLPSNKAPGPD